MICEVCHQEHTGGNQICPTCGNTLPVATLEIEHEPLDGSLPEVRWGTISFDSDFELILLAGNRSIRVQLPQDHGLIVGRGNHTSAKETTGLTRNPFTSTGAELIYKADDQTFFVGLPQTTTQAGVSRQHVLIRNEGYFLTVLDLGSTNGSWLNGVQLLPNQKRLLRNGDLMQLGNLRLKVIFNGYH